MVRRIAVFTGDLSYAVRKGILEVDGAVPDLQWLVIVHAPPRRPAALLRSQWRNIKRNGWRWIAYQAREIFDRVLAPREAAVAVDPPGHAFTVESLVARGNLTLVRVADLHSETSLNRVRQFEPDLGLSLAAPILKPSIFSIPRLGTVNLHKGKLPDYRGMPPAFWELWTDATSVGCSVHQVAEKLDSGAVLLEGSVPREPYSTVRGLQLQLDEVGVHLMRDTVLACANGTIQPRTQAGRGTTYRKPTLRQLAELEKKLRRTQGESESAPRLLKAAAQRSANWLARLGAARALQPRVTVLLYHRVSDSVRDNLTVGVAQFERHMALLRAHCNVLSIEDVVGMERVAHSSRPQVCVTFDDGYADNYENAAMILLRHQVPAAFFVSTGMIGSNRPFPHDVRRGNLPIESMTWDQLREMHRHGFTIGSHTVHHIDCAAEPEATVRQELQQSLDTLRQELGVDQAIFAYPYGGRQHMTAERLQLVKAVGYAACLSAYGGSNVSRVDRFNVLRRGINWQFSDQAFLYQCLGL